MSDKILENIWTFKTPKFTFVVNAVEEHMMLVTDEETERDIENGALLVFGVVAELTDTKTGEYISSDSLGLCVYESYRAFKEDGFYFPEMVRRLIEDARAL